MTKCALSHSCVLLNYPPIGATRAVVLRYELDYITYLKEPNIQQ